MKKSIIILIYLSLLGCASVNEKGFYTTGKKIGFNKITQTNYDKNGYDINGYNYGGYNKDGYDRKGYNYGGYDKEGFNKNGYNYGGYNKNGYDKNGYDSHGYREDGYNENGYNKNGYNKDGYDTEGYNKMGYDVTGYDYDGYDRKGYDKDGYNKDGYNSDGYDKENYNIEGYDCYGYNRNGYNSDGYNKEGYDISGYDEQGNNKDGYDVEGYDKGGYDKESYDRQGYDSAGYDKDGYDCYGYNKYGYDSKGYDIYNYDKKGYDKDGYNKNGYDKKGKMNVEAERLKLAPLYEKNIISMDELKNEFEKIKEADNFINYGKNNDVNNFNEYKVSFKKFRDKKYTEDKITYKILKEAFKAKQIEKQSIYTYTNPIKFYKYNSYRGELSLNELESNIPFFIECKYQDGSDVSPQEIKDISTDGWYLHSIVTTNQKRSSKKSYKPFVIKVKKKNLEEYKNNLKIQYLMSFKVNLLENSYFYGNLEKSYNYGSQSDVYVIGLIGYRIMYKDKILYEKNYYTKEELNK